VVVEICQGFLVNRGARLDCKRASLVTYVRQKVGFHDAELGVIDNLKGPVSANEVCPR
jgi:hypothetical protein